MIIRFVKRYLKKAKNQKQYNMRRITCEESETILCEIELVLNNRPLTFRYENPNDTVLTPNHLLIGR